MTAEPLNLQALQDLAREAKARADAATPGPWAYGGTAMWSNDPDVPDNGTEFDFGDATVIGCCPECDMKGNIPLKANRDFIAAARSDVPNLADAILALTTEVERLQELADFARLLGPARMVLDRCAQQAQRIVDLIGHPVTDEPPHALVERDELRAEVDRLRVGLRMAATALAHDASDPSTPPEPR